MYAYVNIYVCACVIRLCVQYICIYTRIHVCIRTQEEDTQESIACFQSLVSTLYIGLFMMADACASFCKGKGFDLCFV
jgi:hypothetical protein